MKIARKVPSHGLYSNPFDTNFEIGNSFVFVDVVICVWLYDENTILSTYTLQHIPHLSVWA